MITIVLLLSHLLCLWKNISILNRHLECWAFFRAYPTYEKNWFFFSRGPVLCLLVMERRCQSKPGINPTGPTPLIFNSHAKSWILDSFYGILYIPTCTQIFFFDNYWHAYLVLVIHIYTHNSRFLLLHRIIIALGMFIGIICSLLLL